MPEPLLANQWGELLFYAPSDSLADLWSKLILSPNQTLGFIFIALALMFLPFCFELTERAFRGFWLAALLVFWFPMASDAIQRYAEYRQGVTHTSIGLWQDTVEKSPQKLRPRVNLAYAHQEHGDVTEALREYHNAELLSFQADITEPQREEAADRITTAIASLYIHMNRYPEAGKLLVTRWNANPGFPGIGINLAAVLIHDHRPDMAVVILNQTLANVPNYPWLRDGQLATMYLNRAAALALIGDCDAAERDFKIANDWPDLTGKIHIPECQKGL